MTTAFRYVARELALVFAGVFALLLLVGLGGRFIGFLQQAAGGRFSAEALWLLLALRVPEFVQITVPFALFLALLLTFGRLHAEREYVALTSGGASQRRIVGWVLASALPLAALVAALSFVVTPEARRLYAELSLQQLFDSELDAIVPGTFHGHAAARGVTYAEAVDRTAKRLHGVFMAEREGAGNVVVWAQSGRSYRSSATGSRFLELRDGVRYEGVAGQAGYRVATFQRLGKRVEHDLPTPRTDARMVPTLALRRDDARQTAELQWRVSLPLMTVVAALLALGVAKPRLRAGRFARLLPGVGLFVGYYLLLVFAQDAVAQGILPPSLGMWCAHGLALALAGWLLRTVGRPA